MSGFKQVSDQIALATSAGKPSWGGDNGIQSILTNLNNAASGSSIRFVSNTTLLGILTGYDCAFASIDGIGLFRYNPSNALPTPLTAIASLGGGRWELINAYSGSYSTYIGDAVTTSFTIIHGLGTLTPTVVEQQPSVAGGGAPFIVMPINSFTVVDANTIALTYSVAPGSSQYLISIKK